MNHPFSRARWIWSENPGDARFAVRRFRGAFSVETPQTLTVNVSADCRYILFLDGQLVGRGPARADVRHYVYETYALSVTPGRHVLAALVVIYEKKTGPGAEMHDQPGFVLQAQTKSGEIVTATGRDENTWRVQEDMAISNVPMRPHGAYFAIGGTEDVDGAKLPHGWEQPDFDDSAWPTPVTKNRPFLRTDPGEPGDDIWRLVPRDIPLLREGTRVFAMSFAPTPASPPLPRAAGEGPVNMSSASWREAVERDVTGPSPAARGRGGEAGVGAGPEEADPKTWTLSPHTRQELIFETSEYANGYPILEVDGGAGAKIEIVYAEALSKDGEKGVRDARDGTDVVGFSDIYRPGGGTETYSPLHWRAFRFVKLVIETADADLTIVDFSYRLTGFPWERKAEFAVENGPAELQTVMDVDFRTLERCTGETFMDCPYYEQLQYVGDSRLQALLSFVTTGDARLAARAVKLFDWSRLPDGLTQSRYPSSVEQVIPPFSLIWVLMVEDLYRYAPDETQSVVDALPGCRGVLEWFGRHLSTDGVLDGQLPFWNFVDWADGWNTHPQWGVPPPAAHGKPDATINLQYLAALQAYVRLCDALGDTREREFWQAEADMLSDAIALTFWDADARLLREGPDDSWGCTQHAQAWGILTDVIPEEAWEDVVDSLHTDETLTKTTYYHTFYVVEALAKARRLEMLWTHWLAPWRDALALNVQTWPEKPEPSRSDCHAWSAWPTYAFVTHALGVKPSGPGFASPQVTPQRVDGWDKLSGLVPTPDGLLSVTVEWSESGKPTVHRALT